MKREAMEVSTIQIKNLNRLQVLQSLKPKAKI